MKNVTTILSTVAVSILLHSSSIYATNIITYDMSNKQRGAIADPDYGLRLDDLFTTRKESNWTFSFTDNGASVKMDIDVHNSSARIYGTVYGGQDVGSKWRKKTKGLWNLDFTYDNMVTITDSRAGYWELPWQQNGVEANNYGYMQLIDVIDVDRDGKSDEGRYIGLADYHGGSFENTHGKGPYVSAWLESTLGFVDDISNLPSLDYVRPNDDRCCKDFATRAGNPVLNTHDVPAPGALILLSLGLLGFWVRKLKVK